MSAALFVRMFVGGLTQFWSSIVSIFFSSLIKWGSFQAIFFSFLMFCTHDQTRQITLLKYLIAQGQHFCGHIVCSFTCQAGSV